MYHGHNDIVYHRNTTWRANAPVFCPTIIMTIAHRIVPFLRSCKRKYRRLFSIEEIENESILQWVFGAMLFYFFVTFLVWFSKSYITIENAQNGAMCWPYFPNCGDFYFLQALPYGYSQATLYMLFYGAMMLIVYYMWKKQWVYAHILITLLFIWKVLVIFVFSYVSGGPYDYYHLALLAALLFVPHKEFFLKLTFVFLYFMSVTVKFTPAWVLGTYFSSMQSGIPLLPSWSIVIATNIVIFAQIIESWFLLSRNWILQRISLIFALFFHLYSGILVGYDYPSITLPAIAILFGPLYRYTPVPFTRKAIAGWSIIVLIALFQLLGFVTPTDRFLTLEGNRFGMFMFEANHQCVATVTRRYNVPVTAASDFETPAGIPPCSGFYCLVKRTTTESAEGSQQELRYESASARNRCDPYEWWARLRSRCTRDATISGIAFRFDHSIDGGPFYRIIDTPNICALEYKFLARNPWIKLPPEAPIVGYPLQNWYYF